MFYALYSLGVIPNTKGAYSTLSEFTADARRNRVLPIACFADNSRGVIQDFDDNDITLDDYVDGRLSIGLRTPKQNTQTHS